MELPTPARRRSKAATHRLAALTRRAYAAGRPPRWAVSRRAGMTALVVLLVIGLVLGLRAWAGGRQHASVVPVGAGEQQTTGLDGTVGHSDDGLGADGHDAGNGGAAPDAAAPDVPGAAPDPQAAAPGTTDEPPGTQPPSAAGDPLLVHVAGAVEAPGLVTLPPGARVADAISAAGGANHDADLDAVNLARAVSDAEQVYVPTPGEQPAVPPGGDAAAAPAQAPETAAVVDLNSADLTALQSLPGVGPAIAQRIIDWREANGGFHSVEELLEVSGIGPKTLEGLRAQVTV